jgi:multiple sugar transport system substrate-binding protein
MKRLIDTGVVPRAALETPDRESMTTFLAGNAPFHFNWSFTYGMMRDPAQSQITDSVRSMLVPGIVKRTYSSLGGGGYAVAKTTENTEWAIELGKWLTTGDAPRAMLDQRGADMSWVHLYDDDSIYDEYPLLKTYVEQMEIAGIRPNNVLTWYSDFRDNMFLPPVHRALLGQGGIKEALDQAKNEAQKRLDQDGL